ncbi:hypothetical protein LguiA_005662 [Lonicera macranthoides]
MGMSKNWVAVVRRKFFRPSPRETIIILHTNDTTSNFSQEDAATREDAVSREDAQNDMATFAVSTTQREELVLSKEDIAAIKIQAYFRRHLARRAFRALRGLVKLQAVVRGVCVRRQARIALHCMHTLARLQVTVRARQLFSRAM